MRFPTDYGVDRPDLEDGQPLKVTGTNTPTKNTPSVFHVWAIEKSSNAPRINVFAAKKQKK